MREIKFRGYFEPDNIWLYGNLVSYKEVFKMIYYQNPNEAFMYGDVVANKSVGQYTGIKDVNGKEVYEGDILHVTEHENELIKTFGCQAEFDAFTLAECAGKRNKDYVTSIRFCDGGFVFKDEKGCDTDLCVLAGDQRTSSPVYIFDVIGNVYEHPERANASSKC